MLRSVILVAENFQDEEYVYPYYRLQEFSSVEVASADGKDRFGKYGVPARVTTKFSELDPSSIDILFIPGGFECPDRLRIDKDCLKIVRACCDSGTLIAAICHGPWVLISAKVTKGIEMTGYQAIHVDLENSGAILRTDKRVVECGRFITAQHYRDNPEFMKAVLQAAAND